MLYCAFVSEEPRRLRLQTQENKKQNKNKHCHPCFQKDHAYILLMCSLCPVDTHTPLSNHDSAIETFLNVRSNAIRFIRFIRWYVESLRTDPSCYSLEHPRCAVMLCTVPHLCTDLPLLVTACFFFIFDETEASKRPRSGSNRRRRFGGMWRERMEEESDGSPF